MPLKNIVTEQRVTKAKLERARELRREMTPAEKILWEELRANKLASIFGGSRSHLHLRAGASVAGFIVDFYCHQAGLVVEVDGDSPPPSFGHLPQIPSSWNLGEAGWGQDARREKVLSELGLRVVRFGNDDVLMNLSTVVRRIKELIEKYQG